jgi:hypothetical protein
MGAFCAHALSKAHVMRQRAICLRSSVHAHLPNTCPLSHDRDCIHKHAGKPELLAVRCNVSVLQCLACSRAGLPGELLSAYIALPAVGEHQSTSN